MNADARPSRVPDVVKLFLTLQELYGELLTVITGKLEAVRRADWVTLQELTLREKRLTGRLQERHGLRRQLMSLVAREIGLTAAAPSSLTVSQLADRVPGELMGKLTNTAAKLREVVGRVAQANRVFTISTRELLAHIHWMLSTVKPQSEESDGYQPQGRAFAGGAPCLIDAVG